VCRTPTPDTNTDAVQDLDLEDEVPLREASWQEVYGKIQADKVCTVSRLQSIRNSPSSQSFQNQAKKAQPIKDRELHKLGFTVEGQEGDAY
jgi:hypothetical protein